VTDPQRKAIFDVLLGDVSMFPPGDIARKTLEESALAQLNAIEPIVDAMLLRAWQDGNVGRRLAS